MDIATKILSDNISFIENKNSLVILIDKSQVEAKKIEFAKKILLGDDTDFAHIPFVDDREQKEIEELLKESDTHEFISKSDFTI